MRRKVSGATPTLKEVLSKVVTVRHVPAQTRVLVWALAAVFCMCVCVCVCVCVSLTVHADAVAQMGVCEDLFAVRDGQRRAATSARRGIEGLEGGHGCGKDMLVLCLEKE